MHNTSVKCPLCQKVQCRSSEEFQMPLEILESENKSIKRKVINLNVLIDDIRNKIEIV